MSAASVLEHIRRHPLAALIARQGGNSRLHAVGGVVRDAVLGRDSADLDLSVAENGESLARQIAVASGGTLIALGGDRFSSYRVVAGKVQADIWDRDGGSLTSDLERRDLTINSIACALDDGAGDPIEDPFGGLEDLASQRLRATKIDSFDRDPLRVLRLARFRLFLEGFAIEPATAAAARTAASRLTHIASERVRDELQRILGSPSTASAFETLSDLQALETLIPAMAPPSVTRTLLARAQHLDRSLSTLDAVAPGNVDGTGSDSRPDERLHVALALLALSAGGGDPAVGVTDLGARGLATRAALARARRLWAESLPSTESDRRLFLDRHRRDWPLALAVGSAVSSSDTTKEPSSTLALAASELWKTAAANPGLVQGVLPLLDGHQVGRILGLAPGPALGEALRALSRAQALGQISSPGEAEEFLRKRGSKSPPTREIQGRSTSATPVDAD